MTTTLTAADLSTIDVEELVGLVWGSVLGTDIVPCAPIEDSVGFLASSVVLIGDWPGVVSVAAETKLAEALAMHLFDVDADEVTELDRRDALGELTNMTGGNLKALLPGSSHLGLPVVADGAPGLSAQPGSKEWSFLADGLRFIVRITEPS